MLNERSGGEVDSLVGHQRDVLRKSYVAGREEDGGAVGVCGGGQGICCKADDVGDRINWKYVGEGKGGYEAVETFNFVGDGRGNFQADPNAKARACGGKLTCCAGASVLLVLAGAAYALAGGEGLLAVSAGHHEVLQRGPHSRPTTAGAHPPHPHALVHHTAARAAAPSSASAKANSSTSTTTVAATTSRATATTKERARVFHWIANETNSTLTSNSTASYNCTAGYAKRATAWSARKKAWCKKEATAKAAKAQARAASTTTTTTPGGCDSPCDFDEVVSPCRKRIQFSSEHEFKGRSDACVAAHRRVLSQCDSCSGCTLHAADCRMPPTTTTPKPTTPAPTTTSTPALTTTLTLGPTTTTPSPTTTSPPQTTTSPPTTSAQTSSPSTTPTSSIPTSLASLTTTAASRGGCDATCSVEGESKSCGAQIRQSALLNFAGTDACILALGHVLAECNSCSKCTLADSGCIVTTPAPATTTMVFAPHDCQDELANWKLAWSADKKAFCCEHVGTGCEEPTTTTLPFNCEAGYGNWKMGWSIQKKEWCCQNSRRGCVARETPLPWK
mmetsp:Transcript_63698/g.136927  ORF Transcript_63698/g.136927 Transcript_63698/m.136927 type:complete len:561 (+) Transcript_63698:104-1786(+)